MPDLYRVENFIHGLVNFIEEKSAPPGSAASVLNWLAKQERRFISSTGYYRKPLSIVVIYSLSKFDSIRLSINRS